MCNFQLYVNHAFDWSSCEFIERFTKKWGSFMKICSLYRYQIVNHLTCKLIRRISSQVTHLISYTKAKRSLVFLHHHIDQILKIIQITNVQIKTELHQMNEIDVHVCILPLCAIVQDN